MRTCCSSNLGHRSPPQACAHRLCMSGLLRCRYRITDHVMLLYQECMTSIMLQRHVA